MFRPRLRWLGPILPTIVHVRRSNHTLRPYQEKFYKSVQQEALAASLAAFSSGIQRQAVSLPVGAGKTTVFAHLIPKVITPRNVPTARKTLVLAHREELLEQAAQRIAQVNPGLVVDIEAGPRSSHAQADVVVASVPTLGRKGSARIGKFDPQDYKLIVIDEAHHASADTYIRVLDHFNALTDESHVKVWGCSATLQRHDGISLGTVFQHVSYFKSTTDLMQEGYLCGLRSQLVKTDVDLSHVAIANNDFVQAQLARAVNTPWRNSLLVDIYREHIAPALNTTLVFAVDIDHCQSLQSAFVGRGYRAEAVTSETARDRRRNVLDAFRAGDLPILINCGIFTEGTDIPNIDSIIMARPTRSSVLFQQILGRGLRLHPTKAECLFIDVVDCSRHTLVTVPSLLGLAHDFDAKGHDVVSQANNMRQLILEFPDAAQAKSLEEADRIVREAAASASAGYALRDVDFSLDQDPDYLRRTRFSWKWLARDYVILEIPHVGSIHVHRDKEEMCHAELQTIARRGHGAGLVERLPVTANDMDQCCAAIETYIKTKLPFAVNILSGMSMRQPGMATERQLGLLRRMYGRYYETLDTMHMTAAKASMLIYKALAGRWVQRRMEKRAKVQTAMKDRVLHAPLSKVLKTGPVAKST